MVNLKHAFHTNGTKKIIAGFGTTLIDECRMVKITEKLHKAIGALEWFTTRQWQFKCNNVLALSSELKGKDKEVRFAIYYLFFSDIFTISKITTHSIFIPVNNC